MDAERQRHRQRHAERDEVADRHGGHRRAMSPLPPPHLPPRRVSGLSRRIGMAATPDLKLAIGQPVKSAVLIAAPPVEKRTAAATSCRRAAKREGMRQDNRPLSRLARYLHFVAHD